MRSRSTGWGVPVVAVVLAMMAGCGVNSTFVYKPGGPVAGGPKLPVKLAVLPFKDGTENFTKRGSVLAPETLYYNMAKSGISGTITALTPELWAKAFADEMTSSGVFRSVRFLYTPSEMQDEDLYVEGTVEKATYAGAWVNPNEFALGLRAIRRADGKTVWEKEVTRTWKNTPEMYKGCGGFGIQCMVDRYHADANRVMREMFLEARADLVAAFSVPSGGQNAEGGLSLAGEARNEEFAGIGVRVGIAGDVLAVESPVEGTPASKAGLQAGDKILSIDGKPTAGMSVADAVGRIRGVKGTSVTLGVLRAGWSAPRDFTIVRDVIRDGTSRQPAQESVEQTIDRILKGK